jgi:hypothetical protein
MMSDSAAHDVEQSELDVIYAKLPRQDVEEFYAGYQQWILQQHMTELRDAIVGLRQQIEENAELMRQAQPSAIELATLARLQANGVSDIGLLDRMQERGEAWLDATMQRLDYCEQLDDFLSDDYEQWCRHALEGAYDWIDSLRRQAGDEAAVIAVSSPTAGAENTLTEATEELLLSKLTDDEGKDEDSLLEVTLKRPAIMPVELQERSSEDIEPARSEQILLENGEAGASEEKHDHEDSSVSTDTEHEQPDIHEYIAPEVVPAEEGSSILADEQPAMQEFAPFEETLPGEGIDADSGEPPLQEFAPAGEMLAAEERDAGSEEPTIQEFTAIAEPPSSQEDTHPGTEEAVIREYISPAEVPVVEETVDESLDIEQPEEPEEHGEFNGHGDEVIAEQAVAMEEPVATLHEPSAQWKWTVLPQVDTSESQADVQTDEPRQRPNFFWRLLAKIWGR